MKTELQKQKKREKRKAKSDLKWNFGNSEFENFMYENGLEDNTKQYSQYHWRITTIKAIIDIWPGSKKFWIHGTGGSATYDILDEIKPFLF